MVPSAASSHYHVRRGFTWLIPFSCEDSMKKIVIIALLIGLAASSLAAQEWTRFRGPNGTGESEAKGIPATWTDADYAWKAALPGIGHSSPVLWGEKLFLFSASPEDATRYVLCLNAATGKELWRRAFKSDPHHLHLRNSFASCTPAVDEGRVYVAWSTPKKTTFLALTHDGEPVWELDLGPFVSMHGFGTSPIVYKDMVILADMQLQSEKELPKAVEATKPGEAFILAVDRKTGEQRWKTPKRNEVAAYSVPCIYKNAEGKDELISCASNHDIFSLDPLTGKQNWSIEVFSMRAVSSPIIAGGLIFGSTGSGGGGNYVVAVKPGPQPKVAYEVKTQAPYVPTAVAKGDLVFLWSDAGIATCIDAATGSVHWRERVGSNFSGSPIRVADKLYCIDEQGVVYVLAADKKYKLLGKNPLGEPSRATPTVAGGKLFLRTDSQLFAVGK
jgi:outer membrane protein assembly factor BamB